MRASPYSDIEKMVATGMGWDATNLSSAERDEIRQAINEALKWTWECDWWPDVMEMRHLALRDDWSLQNIAVYGPYSVGSQVYFPDSGKYYLAIADVHGEPPAAWNAVTESWDETPTRWKELATSYEATVWEPGTDYPDTEWDVNSVFLHDGRYWLPLLTWFGLAANADVSPTSNPEFWLELPTLDNILPTTGRNRPMVGEMKGVTRLDPRTTVVPQPYEWETTTDGVLVYDFEGPRLWAEYRRACPNFIGDLWDPTVAYSAAPEFENIYGETEEPPTEPMEVVSAPVVLPATGGFYDSQLVTMACATPGATIYYTLDGSTPTTASTVYAGQFVVTSTTTIKAFAAATGMVNSAVVTTTLTRNYALRWGVSTATTLDEAGILALAGTRADDDPAGIYTFTITAAPDKYLFWVWPHSIVDQPVAGTGFTLDGLSITGDLAGAAQGYDQTENGWPYALVSVGGVLHRVYRTLVPQGSYAGPINVLVTT